MKKPTKSELRRLTVRGGRVFLFAWPKDYAQPSITPAQFEAALMKLPGCQAVEGPLVDDLYAITLSDYENSAGELTDADCCDLIAETIHKLWKEN